MEVLLPEAGMIEKKKNKETWRLKASPVAWVSIMEA